MIPTSISASAILSFDLCEARYKAENIDKVPRVDGKAGLLGTACHDALEMWVAQGLYEQEWPTIMDREKAMKACWEIAYTSHFGTREHYAEGWQMVNKWLQRSHWEDRTVLTTEVKERFELPTSIGPIPVSYIFDRKDRLADGSIEVIDYKSVIKPIQADELKHRIQPRLYALAAAIEHKGEDVPEFWVTYDLLRYDTVSARFTREDNNVTWHWLRSIAERIIASDGTRETLNPECRFCVRKLECNALKEHGDGGGVIGVSTLEEAVDRRAQLKYAMDGLSSVLSELDELILNFCEDEGVRETDTEITTMRLKGNARRQVDSERAAKILGPEIMQRYGKIGVTDLDRVLENEELTDSQRSQLKQLVRKQVGKVSVETKPRSSFDEGD